MKVIELAPKPQRTQGEESQKPNNLGKNAFLVIRKKLLGESLNQAILFGKDSNQFENLNIDIGNIEKRGIALEASVKNKIESIQIEHDLIHPFAKHILDEFYPDSDLTSLSYITEYLVTALQDCFDYDYFNPVTQLNEGSTFGNKVYDTMKKIIACFIANSIIVVNSEVYHEMQKIINDNKDSLLNLNSEQDKSDIVVNYNFDSFNISKVKEATENIILHFMNYYAEMGLDCLKDHGTFRISTDKTITDEVFRQFLILGNIDNVINFLAKE
jgi:hypothetical protein